MNATRGGDQHLVEDRASVFTYLPDWRLWFPVTMIATSYAAALASEGLMKLHLGEQYDVLQRFQMLRGDRSKSLHAWFRAIVVALVALPTYRIPVGTVASRLRLGREQFRTLLAKHPSKNPFGGEP
jgi:hypothetical protein